MVAKVISILNSIDSNTKLIELELLCKETETLDCHSKCSSCSIHHSKASEKIISKTNLDVTPGDIVNCKLEAGAPLKAALILCGIPLFAFIGATIIVTFLNIPKLLIFLISFLTLVTSLLVIKFLVKNKTYYFITEIKEKR